MPALIHFRRKWLIACDDLVIPFATDALLRTTWLVGTLFTTFLNYPDCLDDTFYIKYFLYGINAHLFLTISLCAGIFIISSRGSVLEVHKRIHLSKLLYLKCVTVAFDTCIASFGVWLLTSTSSLCSEWKIFIEAAVVCLYLYVFVIIVGVVVCYNSLGSPFFWHTSDMNSAKIWKKAERIWRLRLKLFCCCADISEDKNNFIYVEISNFVAAFSKDVDLTPTDILAGLISLSKKHAIERRKRKGRHTSDALLVSKPAPKWMTADNALYYLKIAKSTYGWFALFQPLQPWNLCTLLSPSRCFKECFHSQSNSKTGDCCYCNSSAVERISGLCDSDILHASFSSLIYEPAFIITIDHTKKAIVVAIRGTCSFSDLITDIDMEEASFPGAFESRVKCHRGALRSALFIEQKIHELQILKTAFVENPSYVLVVTGHSLGASIAAILSLLLYPEYPSLQCYSYAPIAVLSAQGIPITLDLVFSIVVENDMVPRVSAYSCKELIKEISASLEETHCPKYKLLTEAASHYVKRSLKLSKPKPPTSAAYENKQIEITHEPSIQEAGVNILSNEAQLYAPGRILHLRKSERCDYSWITGFHLQNIIISPSVIEDHQPHQIKCLLETYKSFMEENITSQENQKHITETV